jgi:Arc/MetJ-type ribon-helix-helix transcriptional regulator
MTVTKVTVSLDPDVADRARRDVAEGRAKSLSSWLNEAAKARIDREDLQVVLAELLDESGGPPTEAELAQASTLLATGHDPK